MGEGGRAGGRFGARVGGWAGGRGGGVVTCDTRALCGCACGAGGAPAASVHRALKKISRTQPFGPVPGVGNGHSLMGEGHPGRVTRCGVIYP